MKNDLHNEHEGQDHEKEPVPKRKKHAQIASTKKIEIALRSVTHQQSNENDPWL